MESSQSKVILVGEQRLPLVAIARAQRVLLIYAFCTIVAGLAILPLAAASVDVAVATLLALPVLGIAGMFLTTRLSSVCGAGVATIVAGALFMLIPGVGVLVVLLVNQRATFLLRTAGARVGLCGVSDRELRKLIDGACGHCGYDIRGLPGPVCPECGQVIASATP